MTYDDEDDTTTEGGQMFNKQGYVSIVEKCNSPISIFIKDSKRFKAQNSCFYGSLGGSHLLTVYT